MTVKTRLTHELVQEEIDALTRYGSDSTFFHAVAQGWSGELRGSEYDEFIQKCKVLFKSLDAAIGKSTLIDHATLYSAHGNGFGVRGALSGDPQRFVGMNYCYPGYISTSSEADFCDRFLEPRRNSASNPTALEFRLPAGFHAVDMHHGHHMGEFELLLGRKALFRVIEAQIIDGDVLMLVLEPTERSA